MKKKLKAVLFDMDGVLFNSMPYHSEAWHKVMKSHGDRKSTRLNSSHKVQSRMPSSA